MNRRSAICVLLAVLWSLPASAAAITWSEPVRFSSAEETLSLPGRQLKYAVQFGSTRDIEVTLDKKKTVRFVPGSRNDGKSPIADLANGGNALTVFAFQGSGNDAFDKVLSSGAPESGNDASGKLSLRGLTPGKRYTVQLFAIDMRGRDGCAGDLTDCRRRPVDFGDDQGHFSKRVLEGSSSYVLGTFTADRSTQTVIVRGWALNGNGAEAWNLNAVVVYEP